MSLLLRRVTHTRWFDTPAAEDVLADSVTDLKTQENNLSVYILEDNDTAQLETIVIGLATTRDPNKVEYVLIKQEDVESEGFQVDEAQGETASEDANLLHRNIVSLTGKKLVKIATIINEKAKKDVAKKGRVIELLKKAHEEGKLNIEKVTNPKLRELLGMESQNPF